MEGYPSNWRHLSRKCRHNAGWKCEWCGSTDRLTAAHVNHDIENPDPQLLCLCWPCHTWYDSTQNGHPEKIRRRVATFKRNRALKRQERKSTYLDLKRQEACGPLIDVLRAIIAKKRAANKPEPTPPLPHTEPTSVKDRLDALLTNTDAFMHHYHH